MEKLFFASDYMEGMHPAILEQMVRTNFEKTPGYGTDAYCVSAREKILRACNAPDGEVWFISGGTQTNGLVIKNLLRPYQGVISAKSGHIVSHEAGTAVVEMTEDIDNEVLKKAVEDKDYAVKAIA
jgi:threonine aldolase